MSEHAHEFQPTSPLEGQPPQSGAPAPPPEPQRCSLCAAPLAPLAERCHACGMWMGGRGRAVSRPTLLRVGAVFAAIYVAALLVVFLAR